MGASTWPPNPQLFVAPRQSQGAPLSRVACCGGPDMAPKPPTVRRAPAEPGRSSVSRRLLRGPRHGPQTPNCSSPPGRPRALLCLASPAAGAPTWPPNPQLFVAPRQSRGAPRSRVACCGAPTWPPIPHLFVAPRQSRGAPRFRVACCGARLGPRPPNCSTRPRQSRGAPRFRVACCGPRHGPQPPPVRRAPAEPGRSSVSRGLLRGARLFARGEAHVLELDRLTVDAARRRGDPAGELARLHHRGHEARHVGLVLRRRQPLVLAGVPLRLADDAAVG